MVTELEGYLSEEEEALTVPLKYIRADLRKAAMELSPRGARYCVNSYYIMQENRKRAENQRRKLEEFEEPNQAISYMAYEARKQEDAAKDMLAVWVQIWELGRWLESIRGIGPVLAAGLLANIDITKSPTAGAIWRFAGLDPTSIWVEKSKRPWNAKLKVLCWKAGESFVKVQNRDDDVYGHLYVQRKAFEQEQNDKGMFKEQADKKVVGKDTEAYKYYSKGKLPPAHIHARAKRWAVKIFLSHYHHVAYELHFGTPPPNPFVIEHMGHTKLISPPNWPMA
jgi:hypothetical protein